MVIYFIILNKQTQHFKLKKSWNYYHPMTFAFITYIPLPCRKHIIHDNNPEIYIVIS